LATHEQSINKLPDQDLEPTGPSAEEVDRLIAGLEGGEPEDDQRQRAWEQLDVIRQREVLGRIKAAGEVEAWSQRIQRLIDASGYTFSRLFAQRAERYAHQPLFIVPGSRRPREVTWGQVASQVEQIARGLLALTADDEPGLTVAILAQNRLEMALFDLACLTSGIVNVMIPATATEADLAYILRHARVGTVAASSAEFASRVLALREQTPTLQRVITLDDAEVPPQGALPLGALLERVSETSKEDLERRRAAVRINDRATVMYTSGTTGTPKGICFSQRNIVSKRFHRALALPEIGEGDRFLSYLPLFHTFGRFLELTGCIFWGATYIFAESPTIESLLRQMQELKPSVFISIPMKWIQLYEAIAAEVDVEAAEDEEVLAALQRITGGQLRWGLSAAGYLDPEIFRFMQRNGVELMSGFGMTEATGGITMTPPGRYREDSLGPALPGVELSLGQDGELLIRGSYIMEGYLDPPDGAPSFDAQGWFHTGDLMEMSDDGFIRIVDRKKEIYKNVKGQTIAPQKVEQLFKDFDAVSRVFLVGDHRPYNTALFYLDLDAPELRGRSPEELDAHLSSLVVTANSFLSPYERIVDFARIERDFDLELGELTPKNTYRRKTIERNFADTIRLLYQRTTYAVGGVEVLVPNWLFQALGITAQDLEVGEGELRLATRGARLTIRRLGPQEVQVGQVAYHFEGTSSDRAPARKGPKPLNLGTLLSAPLLWLGNEELLDFAPLGGARRTFKKRRHLNISWARRLTPYGAEERDRELVRALTRPSASPDLGGLHPAALLLTSDAPDDALLAVRALDQVLGSAEGDVDEATRFLLRRAAMSPLAAVVRRAFQVLVVSEPGASCRRVLGAFLDAREDLLDGDTTGVLVERELGHEQLEAFFSEAEARVARGDAVALGLLGFLAEYGASHPTSYRAIRTFVTRIALSAGGEPVQAAARGALARLRDGFHAWLGSPSRVAVDPETGQEYRWEDVVAFSDDVQPQARERLLEALRSTSMLREGVFLFSQGATVGLTDILPGGIWIRLLGADHGKTVYRLAVKTRGGEQFDLAINVNHELTEEQVAEEIDWLVVCSAVGERGPLAEEFGGWWPEHGLWTEEFISGDTLDRSLKRISRRPQERSRLHAVWLHTAWSGLAAYIDFWDRTGRRLEVADPKPANVVVPTHDYHTSARLVSISARRPFGSITAMLATFQRQFIEPVEREHEQLAGLAGWDTTCAALLEVVGEEEGQRLLQQVLDDPASAQQGELRSRVECFLESVRQRGFLPLRLFFARKRYRKWARLNPEATTRARARTLREIYSTYALETLQEGYPEARSRFFRDTVFRAAGPAFAEGLDGVIRRLRRRELEADELGAAVADIRAHLELEEDDDYFLTRLCYPYLQPEDEATYVDASAAGVQQSEMVVTVIDTRGDPYRIRHALSAKEIGRLHRHFAGAKLPVQFRKEHRFLVAVSERGNLMGGLFYELIPEFRTAHMDKIVVAEAYRGRGISSQLIEELCNRGKTAGLASITTGFFRPQFFYRRGFSVERRYAGLVRRLVDEAPAAT
jgi:long-chain acyl-CoA synthetase